MYNNVNSYIFRKKINSDYRLMPFNVSINDTGKTKYLPPVAKEWKNSVYNYDSNNLVNYPVYDLKLNKLIKSYFNLYFNSKSLQAKYISPKKKKLSFNKIFVSKAEIKHTSSKAIITIYVYNRENRVLRRKVENFRYTYTYNNEEVKYLLFKQLLFFFINEKTLRNLFFSSVRSDAQRQNKKGKKSPGLIFRLLNLGASSLFEKDYYLKNNRKHYIFRRLMKKFSYILAKIRRFKLRLRLNRYKFEEILLSRLSRIINKQYGKKVEFNIVNLKSFTFHGDIFTEILTKKIRKERRNPGLSMNLLLSKVKLHNVNTIIERARVESNIDKQDFKNRYKNSHISSILYNNNPLDFNLDKLLSNVYFNERSYANAEEETLDFNLDKLLSNLYFNERSYASAEEENLHEYLGASTAPVVSDKDTIQDIIFKNIKYKNMAGVKIRVKGRLTKRYRADRAVFKLKWKGGLKNIDSAFRGLSSVVFRGYLDSNVEKSILSSKRRIGSFAVKGWFGGK